MMRIVIADDHPIVLDALADMLVRAGHDVTATARAGDDARLLIVKHRPDAAVLDIAMPGQTGLEVLRHLRAEGDRTPIILLTGALDDATLVEAVQLNVEGIVLKESASDMLLRCLDTVGRGGQWIDREAMSRALHAMSRASDLPRLTPREAEILALVGRGLRNRVIADELGMSEGTVKAHLSNIFDKVGVTSRAELLLKARDLGLI